MKCDRCKKTEATVHLKQVMGDRIVSLNLCPRCAREEHLAGGETDELDLISILKALAREANRVAREESEEKGGEGKTEVACPACGWTSSLFAEKGIFGCPGCYEALEQEVQRCIEGLHRERFHRGKHPGAGMGGEDGGAGRAARLVQLAEELTRAVATESYEEAALLRDQIKQLTDPQ